MPIRPHHFRRIRREPVRKRATAVQLRSQCEFTGSTIAQSKGDFAMRFRIIGKATAETEKGGALPDPQYMAEMGKFNEELMKAGVLLASDGLHPGSKGPRVKFSGKSRTSSTARSPRPRSSSPASRSGRSSPSKRPSSGSSVPPTPTPSTPNSKSARSLRWKTSHPSCPKSRSSTK